jgi:UDP-N-acetylmuramoyl-tripeptide--D-alanyl-D-alanine ligase
MKEIIWQSSDAEEALGVKSSGQWRASGVSIDTRTIEEGDLFVALRGDNNDGHIYLNEAANKGAAAALVDSIPDDFTGKIPTIIVTDVLEALVALAKYKRAHTKAKIIGITGSVGKTSVKEGVAQVLGGFGKVHTTIGNLNNHIGLPLSLARMAKDCDFAVLELGMSGAGEISYLSKILQPDIAVITNIKPMHLEFFDSVEAIARAKAEIFDGMKNDGIAILPRDDKFFDILNKTTPNKVLSFGLSSGSNVLLLKNNAINFGQNISLQYEGELFDYLLPIFGDHHAINSAIIFAVCTATQIDLNRVTKSLSKLEAIKGRGKITKVSHAGKNFTLIDDSYNAGPDSMRAAFSVLSEIKKQNSGRAIALLGDMLELGEKSQEFHRGLSVDILESNLDKVFTAGVAMNNLTKKLPEDISGGNFDSPADILPEFEKYVADGDVVLVKGSNGSKMWELVDVSCQ